MYKRIVVFVKLDREPGFHVSYYIHKIFRECIERFIETEHSLPPHHIHCEIGSDLIMKVTVNLFPPATELAETYLQTLTNLPSYGPSIVEEVLAHHIQDVRVRPPDAAADAVTVRFHAPTRFLNPLKTNVYNPFPDPINFFWSAANASQLLLGYKPDIDEVIEAAAKVKVVKFAGKTSMLNGLYKWLGPGFIGQVHYDLTKLNEQQRYKLTLLTEIATHTGVGIGRSYTGHITYKPHKRKQHISQGQNHHTSGPWEDHHKT